ncbi:MAG: MerR family transcriptional regulator, partial [Candidatus Omnitrophica bacterium]|nr:MerR family transcriptional regulator [Candidatus Omnitrophota bacterium]
CYNFIEFNIKSRNLNPIMKKRQRSIFKINHLAKELGVSIQTIKNYEASGILPAPRRDDKGWRYYTEEDIIKIKALYQEEIKHVSREA